MLKTHYSQLQRELSLFLQQHHLSLEELWSLFPQGVPFVEKKTKPKELDPFFREEEELEYLPTVLTLEENVPPECLGIALFSRILKEIEAPFLCYCLVREVLPLPRGFYLYHPEEHALRWRFEPSSKLFSHLQELPPVPATLLLALPLGALRSEFSPEATPLLLAEILLKAGRWWERWTQIPQLHIEFQGVLDTQEIGKRLEISEPLLGAFHLKKILPQTRDSEIS